MIFGLAFLGDEDSRAVVQWARDLERHSHLSRMWVADEQFLRDPRCSWAPSPRSLPAFPSASASPTRTSGTRRWAADEVDWVVAKLPRVLIEDLTVAGDPGEWVATLRRLKARGVAEVAVGAGGRDRAGDGRAALHHRRAGSGRLSRIVSRMRIALDKRGSYCSS